MILHHNIDIKQLKPRGYKFGKFFASNYKAYSSEIGGKSIIIWVAGKDIQIDGMKDKIEDVIRYYKSTRDRLIQHEPDRGHAYFVCYVSSLDLPVVGFDKFGRKFILGDDELEKEYDDGKYAEFVSTVESFDKIVSEVEWLIGREIK
jgi:hypothetical protein